MRKYYGGIMRYYAVSGKGPGAILRAIIPEESVMVRTAQAAEVSSTTSIPGPCSGPQTTPAILEYQPAEKIRECACIVSKIV